MVDRIELTITAELSNALHDCSVPPPRLQVVTLSVCRRVCLDLRPRYLYMFMSLIPQLELKFKGRDSILFIPIPQGLTDRHPCSE